MSRRKINKFDYICNYALQNIPEWNKKVKSDKYKINNSDSYSDKIIKVYRCVNEGHVDLSKAKYIDSREII